MKISLDDEVILNFSETQKKIFQNETDASAFNEKMKAMLKHFFSQDYSHCFSNLKREWEPKLVARGFEMLPAIPEKFAELVFSQPDYRNKSQRDAETKAELEARMALEKSLLDLKNKLESDCTVQVI